MRTEDIFELFKEWLTVSNPGLATREDLTRLESKVDELLALVAELEVSIEHLANGGNRGESR